MAAYEPTWMNTSQQLHGIKQSKDFGSVSDARLRECCRVLLAPLGQSRAASMPLAHSLASA